MRELCNRQIEVFLKVYEEICFLVALEKTFWASNKMIFLGLLLDTLRQVICIPMEKLIKAINWVDYFLDKKSKKATVQEFQKLCGTLNLLCRCIVPGRVFLRRLYINTTASNGLRLKPHHHVRITEEHRLDLMIWRQLLTSPDSYYRPFMEVESWNACKIDMFSDASGNYTLGFGAYCGPEWCLDSGIQNSVKQSNPPLNTWSYLGSW